MNNTIIIASDHGGLTLKEQIKTYLEERGTVVIDLGTNDETSVDYPDYAKKVASLISQKKQSRGILICGTGIGMSIAANRFPGVRGTLCHDLFTAQMSREHNDSNLLILGERVLDASLAKEIVKTWLTTAFGGDRHNRRLKKIDHLLDREEEKE